MGVCLYYGRCVAPPGKQLSPDSSLRSHTTVQFYIWWTEVRKPKARFLLGLCGFSPSPASSPQWCMVPKTAKMMEIVTNSLVNMQVIFSFLLLWERRHYKFANSFFFSPGSESKTICWVCGAAKILLSSPQHLEFKLLQMQGARKLFSCCSRQIKSCSLRLRVISRDSVRLWERLLSCESLASCYWNLIKEHEMLSKIRVMFPSVYMFSIKGTFI